MRDNATSTPLFPYWYQVIEEMYESPLFIGCIPKKKEREESLIHYKSQVKLFKETFVFPIVEPDKMVQRFDKLSRGEVRMPDTSEREMFDKYSILNAQGNQFTLIGDAHKMTYLIMSENLKDVLGLPSNEDFDLFRLCGLDEKYELYHPEDVFHIIRLGEAILQTAGILGVKWTAFEDTYQIEFRIGHSDPSRWFTVTRQCQLSDPHEGPSGRRHIDIWKIVKGHDQFSHVKVNLFSGKDSPMLQFAHNLFFATNAILLGFTPRDVVLANYLSAYAASEYCDKLNTDCRKRLTQNVGFGRQACSDMKRNLITKINSRMVENTKGNDHKKEVVNWSVYRKCGQLGVLNIPTVLEKAIWNTVKPQQ